jgi:F-type H+-transporting ATPase subunit b
MPQLSQIGEIYASQLFWLAIVFALIYFGIGRAMVPKIERTIDDRDARIASDLDAAESARAAASTLDHDYHVGLDAARSTALRDVTEARAKATAASEKRVKAGDAKLATALAEATARISASRDSAMTEIEAATAEAVQDIVAKLSGVKVDRATAAAKVKAELAHG